MTVSGSTRGDQICVVKTKVEVQIAYKEIFSLGVDFSTQKVLYYLHVARKNRFRGVSL